MKRVIFIWVVVLAVCALLAFHFCFPAKARAGEETSWAKQAVIELNRANVNLAEEIEALLKLNNLSSIVVYDEVDKKTVVVPNGYSLLFAKELISPSGEDEKCVELAMALADYNRILRTAQSQLILMSGSKK